MTEKKVEQLYNLFLKHPLISLDSRNVQKDSLFFALKGEHFNGNRFAKSALQKGASYAIIDEPYVAENDNYILVEDSLDALQRLARHHRERLDIPFIGITGSNGKTTTKELISCVLGQKYNLIATRGNLNNHIGVPLTILQINNQHDLAVIEMGANHQGEIAFLCEIARPQYGIITNVGKAHLEGMGGLEGVKKTKKELYDFIRKVNGKILVNIGDVDLMSIADDIPRLTYGSASTKARVKAHQIRANPRLSLEWSTISYQKVFSLDTQLLGEYNWTNVMAAIAAGILFEVPATDINNALASYKPSDNRSQYLVTDSNEVILDAYNANPTSMQKALTSFMKLNSRNKCLILGEMKEIGVEAGHEHENIVEMIRKNREMFDNVFFVGEEFSKLSPKAAVTFTDSEELKEYLKKHPVKGKTILVKGSRVNQLESLIEVL
ncbi:MAG: UDP-N-acetylmuramoyl-tripeptide--D-alanyl-D-alanine ligase [Bacteroidales bacterium]|nr:UDP-N-acetylmuramoyl-tripeptide--D-alanyl-D-alanine ligase [Bacteroidales bacterium]MCF8332834.1 UDP-N-acetylmuramoyl-tripeptide--D-alanyl-D-alanine ligase [Bacteroidales bacterium]